VTDYFTFFGLPRQLELDEGELQKKFYELSRKYHPDRFARATPREQQEALEATSVLNDGYRVLRNPVQRAEYVLKQDGFDIGEQRSKDVPPELLEEVFELNEQLEELRSGDAEAAGPLRQSRDRFLGLLDDVDGELNQRFREHDAASESGARRAVLAKVRGVLNRRKYIRNLVNEVEKELSAH